MRSYRGPNTDNLQPSPGDDTEFLGREQLDWLKRGLENSRALWKVIAADMPVGLNVGDGKSGELTVDLRDLGGASVFSKTLSPRGG